jgi:membrane protease YdiL (CAAX protease family)
MSIFYISRIINGLIVDLTAGLIDIIGYSATYALHVAAAVMFSYIIPILTAMLAFKTFRNYKGALRILYKKPKRLARALGSFPAMYGFGYGIALITLLISFLISKVSGGQTFVDELFRPNTLEPTSNIASALTMVFLLVVVAPIFEEFLVRGIMYDALKPYGCGMAIIISSVLFGLMHGRLSMLFYTTALGFALGYIRYATNSLFVTTILHAIINAFGAGTLLLLSLMEISGGEHKLINTIYGIYIIAVLILIIVGIIAFIRRIPVIRQYKIDNEWTILGPGKKTALFFLSIPVIIMLVFSFNEHTNNWLLGLIVS